MTAEELLASLEQDIEWRDAELRELNRELSDEDTVLGRARRRAMVPMVQAHAEGFVRFALQAYLRFISAQAVQGERMREVHLAWMLSPDFNRVRMISVDDAFLPTGIDPDNKKAKLHYSETRFLEALGQILQRQVVLDDSPLDQFDQNLNKPYFLALLYHCGLDPAPHNPYAGKLNGLVMRRNEIAHGDHSAASVSEIAEWLRTVQDLFKGIRDEVFSHAARERYLKSTVV